MIRARINVTRIVEAMEAKGLNIVDTCAVCGVTQRTLAKILSGEMPTRIDAFYRVVRGLEIPVKEAVIAGPGHAPVFKIVPRRTGFPTVA